MKRQSIEQQRSPRGREERKEDKIFLCDLRAISASSAVKDFPRRNYQENRPAAGKSFSGGCATGAAGGNSRPDGRRDGGATVTAIP